MALRSVGGCEAELVACSAPSAAEFVQLRCMRPLVEWVLRKAVLAEPGVVFRSGAGPPGCSWTARAGGGCVG